MFESIFHQLSSVRDEPLRVLVEVLLIGLIIWWFAAKLEGTRGTRPLRRLLLVLLVVTLAVRILTLQIDWTRLRILYNFFVAGIGITALIAFQPELRRAFIRVGDVRFARRHSPKARLIKALVAAAGSLSRNKHGALIVIERGVDLRGWAENGTLINSELSANLLTTIFFPNTPLHDLGTIVRENRILAANCQLPTVESDEHDASLGSRHLAAVGMSYESDALVLVVSEETGTISLADNGRLTRYLSLDELEHELESRLTGPQFGARRGRHAKSVRSNVWYLVRRFLLVVPLTGIIWFLADQASLVETDVQIELQPRPPLNHVVEIVEPQPARFKVTLRGANRKLDRLRPSPGQPVVPVDWQLAHAWASPGDYTVDAADLVRQLAFVSEQGLDVTGDVRPDRIRFRVDRIVKQRLPVLVAADQVTIADARIDPPEVEVTLTLSNWEAFVSSGVEPRAVRVNVGPQLGELDPGELSAPFDVLMPLRLGDTSVIAIEPQSVNVRLQIAARSQGVIETVPVNLPVRMSFSPAIWQRYNEGQYEIVKVEPLEWLIKELKVRGEEGSALELEGQNIEAHVVITGDLFDSPGVDTTLDVRVDLPPGISLAGPPPQVRVRVEQRPPGGP